MEIENNSGNETRKAKDRKKRGLTTWVGRHEPVFRAAEMALLAFAFLLSIWTLRSSGKFASQVESHLKNLDTLFASVESRIEALPHSVDKFDSTIRDLTGMVKEQQKELSSSIGGLRKDVDLFSNSLLSYEKKLSEIVEVSDKQLLLLKRTQASWEQEISRKPDLRLICDKVEKIENHKFRVFPVLMNLGNQIAENASIVLRVPREFGFKSSAWLIWDSSRDRQSWNYSIPDFIYYATDTTKVPKLRLTDWDFTIESNRIPEPFILRFEYTIYHDKGSQTDTLIVRYGK